MKTKKIKFSGKYPEIQWKDKRLKEIAKICFEHDLKAMGYSLLKIKIPKNLELRDYIELLINNSNLTPKDKEIIFSYMAYLREGYHL